jgi:hypothetical protein
MSLARLWRDQRRVQEARELLAPMYDWFTEGFDTRESVCSVGRAYRSLVANGPEKLFTKLRGFLISWAIPAVNWPSVASFWVWTSRSCATGHRQVRCGTSWRKHLKLGQSFVLPEPLNSTSSS